MGTKGARSGTACALAALVLVVASPEWGGASDAGDAEWKAIEAGIHYVREDFSLPPLERLQWAVRAGVVRGFGRTDPTPTSFALVPEVGWTLGGLQWGWRAPTGDVIPQDWHIEWMPGPPRRLTFGLGADALLLPAHWERSSVRPLARLAYSHYTKRYHFMEAALGLGPTFGPAGTGAAGSLSFVLLAAEVSVRYGFVPANSEHSLALTLGYRNVHRVVAP